MSEVAFRQELIRMCRKQELNVDVALRTLPFMQRDISRGARFINVFQGFKTYKRNWLVVTSEAVFGFSKPFFSMKQEFCVSLDALDEVSASRSLLGANTTCIEVVIDLRDGQRHRMQVAMGSDLYDRTLLEIAADSAVVVADEITSAQVRHLNRDARSTPLPGNPQGWQGAKSRKPFAERDYAVVQAKILSFFEATRPHWNPSAVGRVFGEEAGLRDCMQVAFKIFDDIDEVRQAGSMIALEILMDRSFGPQELNEVMGLAQIPEGVAVEPAASAQILAGAAMSFMGEFAEEGAETWEFWKERDDVALEFLCWHSVARQRLQVAGLLEPMKPMKPMKPETS